MNVLLNEYQRSIQNYRMDLIIWCKIWHDDIKKATDNQ